MKKNKNNEIIKYLLEIMMLYLIILYHTSLKQMREEFRDYSIK